jgi:hypothetical protein
MLSNLLALPTSRYAIGLAILPVAIPLTYLLYLDRAVKEKYSVETGLRSRTQRVSTIQPTALTPPTTLPHDVLDNKSEWVLAYERVTSEPVQLSRPPLNLQSDLSGFLTSYVRGTMTAFSRTPQAFVLWASVGDSRLRKTFNAQFIQNLEFQEGDRVNGFWRVAYRGDGKLPGSSERIEMLLDAPSTYKGPVTRGVVVAEVSRQDIGDLVFINETWMWRTKSEASVLLERSIGQWLHTLLSAWLVRKGIEAVTVKMESACEVNSTCQS